MENTGSSNFLRNRRWESFLNTSSGQRVEETPKVSVKEESERRLKTDIFSNYDDEGWLLDIISWIRIVICFVSMMVTTFIWALIMLVLIPRPNERIRQGNIYGHVTGRMLMWILGNPIKIEGSEYANKRAIYISNHASPIDIFLIMWLTPTGTVGIAKKEAARAVVRNNPSLIIFPEGTRSKNGRLLPFKKGFIHLAIQSRLPIVPMVLTGTHRAWRKGSLHVRPAPLAVKYLSPISTENWRVDKIDDYVKMVHNLYAEHLPENQRPLP